MTVAVASTETKLLQGVVGPVDHEGTFEGYASLFGVADLGGDIIEAGAFTNTLNRRGAAGVRMLWQHDAAEPLGIWLSLTEDAHGLRVRGRLNAGVRRADDVRALLRNGAVDGLSIGFRTGRARREGSVRRIFQLDLWEVSIVTFPMAPGARIFTPAPDTTLLTPHPATPLAGAIRRAAAALHA